MVKIVGLSVQPIQERAYCHCGEELKARDGRTGAVGTRWRHICVNGHFWEGPLGESYPRIVQALYWVPYHNRKGGG